MQADPKSKSRKVNGYVKAVRALQAVRRRRQERYDRFVRPLDRKRDALVAETAVRMRALSGGQHAEALRILGVTTESTSATDGAAPPSSSKRPAGGPPGSSRPRSC